MLRLLIFITLFSNNSKPLTPQEYFGDSYDEALEFCISNSIEFEIFFNKYGIDPKLACAVVFPEIVRYNRFRDFMETSALELAYISGGSKIADFSIGRFQMKPSFVEMLENEVSSDITFSTEFEEIIKYPENLNETQLRSQRLTRLKQQKWQQLYLACFIKLVNSKFVKELRDNPEHILLIYSSAYNLGLDASYNNLIRIANTKTFPYGKNFTGRFSYYDVASFYYLNQPNQTLTKL